VIVLVLHWSWEIEQTLFFCLVATLDSGFCLVVSLDSGFLGSDGESTGVDSNVSTGGLVSSCLCSGDCFGSSLVLGD